MCPPYDGFASIADDMPPVHIDRLLNVTRASTTKGRDYWLALRGDKDMPARADISPRSMREFLPYVGLIEFTPLPGNLHLHISFLNAPVEGRSHCFPGRARDRAAGV